MQTSAATTLLLFGWLGSASARAAAPPVPTQQTVPVATPTGAACAGSTEAPPSTPTNLAQAVAGCANVQPTGANYTRNDILDGICKPFTLIFARGTYEDPNLGNIVGPSYVDALDKTFGAENVAVQGVNDYPALGTDYCVGGSLTGSENLASLIKQTLAQCPETKLSVSGYSQGCQVVHNGIALLGSDKAATDFINSVVLFGDPDRKVPLNGVPARKVSIDCHAGDNICANGDMILQPHLTYCRDVSAEAGFAKARSVDARS